MGPMLDCHVLFVLDVNTVCSRGSSPTLFFCQYLLLVFLGLWWSPCVGDSPQEYRQTFLCVPQTPHCEAMYTEHSQRVALADCWPARASQL